MKTGRRYLSSLRRAGRYVGPWLGAVALGLILLTLGSYWSRKLSDEHPASILAVLLVSCFLAVGYCLEVRESLLRMKPASDVAIDLATAVPYLVFLAAVLSTFLARLGWAHYATASCSADADTPRFFEYYLWLLIDMLPGIDATSSLHWSRPMTPQNMVAGLPVIVYRAIVVLWLLRQVGRWLGTRVEPRAAG